MQSKPNMKVHLISSHPLFGCSILPQSFNKVPSFIGSKKKTRCRIRKSLILHAEHKSSSAAFRLQLKFPVTPLFCNMDSANDDEGSYCDGAMEVVLRLYSGIKRRDFREISDVIGDECRCVSNIIEPLEGKQEVLEFFTSLMRIIGNHVEFVIQPVSNDGINVVLRWKLECSKTHALLGNGVSFHVCHRLQGNVVIRNIEIFMEPILHIEPIKLKLSGVFLAIMSQVGVDRVFTAYMEKDISMLLGLLIMVFSFLLFFVGLQIFH